MVSVSIKLGKSRVFIFGHLVLTSARGTLIAKFRKLGDSFSISFLRMS